MTPRRNKQCLIFSQIQCVWNDDKGSNQHESICPSFPQSAHAGSEADLKSLKEICFLGKAWDLQIRNDPNLHTFEKGEENNRKHLQKFSFLLELCKKSHTLWKVLSFLRSECLRPELSKVFVSMLLSISSELSSLSYAWLQYVCFSIRLCSLFSLAISILFIISII